MSLSAHRSRPNSSPPDPNHTDESQRAQVALKLTARTSDDAAVAGVGPVFVA
jgi:hypothetical protein